MGHLRLSPCVVRSRLQHSAHHGVRIAETRLIAGTRNLVTAHPRLFPRTSVSSTGRNAKVLSNGPQRRETAVKATARQNDDEDDNEVEDEDEYDGDADSNRKPKGNPRDRKAADAGSGEVADGSLSLLVPLYLRYPKLKTTLEQNNIFLSEELAELSGDKFVLRDRDDPVAESSYSIDKRMWDYLETNVVAGFVLPHTSLQSSPWANRWEIVLLASQGQSLQYLDAMVDKIAVDLGADVLRFDDMDLEEIIGDDLDVSDITPSMGWAKQEDISYRFRDVEPLNGNRQRTAVYSQHGKEEEDDIAEAEVELEATMSKYLSATIDDMIRVALQKRNPSDSARVQDTNEKRRPLLIHVRDYLAILESKLGDAFMAEIEDQITRRRLGGHPIILVGTAHKPIEFSDNRLNLNLRLSDLDVESGTTGYLQVSDDTMETITNNPRLVKQVIPLSNASFNPFAKLENLSRLRHVNVRYLNIYLRRLLNSRPENVFEFPEFWDMDQTSANEGLRLLSDGLLTPDLVFNLVTILKGLLTKEGLTTVNMDLLDRAVTLYRNSRELERGLLQSPKTFGIEETVADPYHITKFDSETAGEAHVSTEASELPTEHQTDSMKSLGKDLRTITAGLTKREKTFMNRYVTPDDITVTFESVIAPPRTLDVLRDTVMLSLAMPEEFSYGVLATNATSGILLYGPPGTGKTLLVRALAKAGHVPFIEVRPSDIHAKYYGESEKNVNSLFSLARKLSPCILFVDEVDSLMHNRSHSSSSSSTDREMINQFMSEWDGLRNKNERILVIGTTNRPFDLDDAVLRRFPRRVMVDLPTEKNREDIFQVHLKDEILDDSVSLRQLAKDTQYFSGSDIKNVCVVAATQAVKERRDNPELAKMPRRVLTYRHFEIALKETGSSISDEMSSVTMIREWDKQFGQDGKRKQQSEFGFSKARDTNRSHHRHT